MDITTRKKLYTTLLALLIVVVMNAGVSRATDWYVRPISGEYGPPEDGSSYANAFDGFAGITWGVGGVVAGDTLYVCGTFRERLDIGYSGSSGTGNRITISKHPSYDAIILGSTNKNSASDWSNSLGGNLWRTVETYDVDPGWVLFGDELQSNVGTYVPTSSTCGGAGDALDTDKEFCYDNTNKWLVVYSPASPEIQYTNVEVGRDDIGAIGAGSNININNDDYITVDGITARYGGGKSILIKGGSSYVTVQNCNLGYNGGVYMISSAHLDGGGIYIQPNSDNIIITNNTITQQFDGAIACEIWDTSAGDINNITIYNNTLSYSSTGVEVIIFGENVASTIHDVTIQSNQISNIGTGWAGYGTRSSGIGIQVAGIDGSIIPSAIDIIGNSIKTVSGIGIELYGCTDTEVSKNYIQSVTQQGINSYKGTGYYTNSATVSYNVVDLPTTYGIINNINTGTMYFYNNTVYKTSAGSSGMSIIGASTGSTWKNNIIYTTQALALQVGSTSSATIDYNLYYRSSGVDDDLVIIGTTNYCSTVGCDGGVNDWADYLVAVDDDDNSIAGSDPLFISAGSNFHLASNSPAKDVGTNVSLTSDFDGQTVPYNNTQDIGAYEWVPFTGKGVYLNGASPH